MITGSNSVTASTNNTTFKPVSGLGASKLLIVNPTMAEYEKLVGRPNPYELNYDITKTEEGVNIIPYRILCHNEVAGFHFMNLNVYATPEVSQAGNNRFVDVLGNSTWGASLDAIKANPKMEWFKADSARQLNRGEVSIIELIKALARYSSKAEGANLMADLSKGYGLKDFTNMAETVKGLNKLLADYTANMVTLFYVVKPVGEKFYTEINTKNDTFYTTNPDNTPSSKAKWLLTTKAKECAERGVNLTVEGRLAIYDNIAELPDSMLQTEKLNSKPVSTTDW